MKKFCIDLGGIAVKIYLKNDSVFKLFAPYVCNEKPLFKVKVTKRQMLAEQEKSDVKNDLAYTEFNCIMQTVAEKIYKYNAFIFNGACIQFNGKGYLFCSEKGVGKSTHIWLWHKFLGDQIKVVNGDKPLIVYDEKTFYACGTPWAGKEGWQTPVKVPISAIIFLEQGKNKIEKTQFDVVDLLKKTYIPQNKDAFKTLCLMVERLQNVSAYNLSCDISEKAVKTCFEGITGLKYKDYKSNLTD